MYVLDQFLTSGAFGIVFKGHQKDDKTYQVAIKIPLSCTEFKTFDDIKPYLQHLTKVAPQTLIRCDPKHKDVVEFKREANLLANLNQHENVIRLIDFRIEYFQLSANLILKIPMIVTEYCDGGNLLQFLQRYHPLSEKMANYLFRQLIQGIKYAHSLNIVHHDIKLENLLLKKKSKLSHSSTMTKIACNILSVFSNSSTQTTLANDENQVDIFDYQLKICDWGFSRMGINNLKRFSGSPHYSSPEIYMKSSYLGTPVDIWSAGVCLFAMATGKLPFMSSDPETLKSYIVECKYDRERLRTMVSDSLYDLLRNILIINSSNRFTIDQIQSHPWYNAFGENNQ